MRIETFPLAWRWTQKSHANFPNALLATLEPIESSCAYALYEKGIEAFPESDATNEIACATTEENNARKWLGELPLSTNSSVTIVWSRELGLKLPWGIFTAYWDDFCYPGSDDAFIFLPNESGIISYEHYEIFRYKAGAA